MFQFCRKELYRSVRYRMQLRDSRIPMLFFQTPRHYCVDDKENKKTTIPVIASEEPKNKTIRKVKLKGNASSDITLNKHILLENGVTVETIVDHPSVLWTGIYINSYKLVNVSFTLSTVCSIDACDLKGRLELIQRMKPKHINDFVPLLLFDQIKLEEVVNSAQNDIHVLPNGYIHRIYYLSDKLQVKTINVVNW